MFASLQDSNVERRQPLADALERFSEGESAIQFRQRCGYRLPVRMIRWMLFDLVQGAPLRTPAVLGRVIGAILRGLPPPDPGSVAVSLAPILGYTLIHGLAFAVVGILAAFLVEGAEREPAMLLEIGRAHV